MNQEEFIKILTYLGAAYGKEYTQNETSLHYDFLHSYSYETFKKAVQNIIRTSKFLPKVSELIEECDRCKEQIRYEILDYMQKQRYFKTPIEYEKATMFMEIGVVPNWLQTQIDYYYKMMKQEEIKHREKLMINE